MLRTEAGVRPRSVCLKAGGFHCFRTRLTCQESVLSSYSLQNSLVCKQNLVVSSASICPVYAKASRSWQANCGLSGLAVARPVRRG